MGLRQEHTRAIEAGLGARVVGARALSGGCVGEVYEVALEGGEAVVAKVAQRADGVLPCEAWMLQYLASNSALPAPRALLSGETLLVMERLSGTTGAGSDAAQRHAAELLAELHAVTADRFGLERDTRIGGLAQANTWADSWVEFFAQRRLRDMARQAADAGRLPQRAYGRALRIADRLGGLIDEPAAPSLVHGDVWSGNVLCDGERVTGFVDPAIYYGHPEVELAFITLFGTFGRAFFDRYHEIHPVPDAFFQRRRHVYNLYPLLVHVRLFGGGYVAQLEASLDMIEGW